MRVPQSEVEESLAYLRRTLQPGATVYTILRSVSRSGMQREVDFYAIRDNRPVWLAGAMSRVLGYRQSKHGSLIVRGCGLDVAWYAVYELGRVLFPDGGPLELSPREHQERRNGATVESDGGYLLRQESL